MENVLEKWEDIADYEGLYQISNYGRVKSLYNYKRDGTNILKPRLKKGYYVIGLRKNGKRKWAYTKEGTKALGGKKAVAEWDKATGDRKLPKYASKKGK